MAELLHRFGVSLEWFGCRLRLLLSEVAALKHSTGGQLANGLFSCVILLLVRSVVKAVFNRRVLVLLYNGLGVLTSALPDSDSSALHLKPPAMQSELQKALDKAANTDSRFEA